MKTKNKMIAMVEIVIVLCSVFLVALPVIAAEQNQEMQKASASTSEVTTTSEDDYVLGVYGNANEDDTIDMRDLTYVKLIFFGKKPVTELADAKYDGKINPLDFIQIKLIIVGKEKELTVIERSAYREPFYEKAKTFHLPIETIIPLDDDGGEPLRVLGAEGMVIAVGTGVVSHDIILPEMSELPTIGSGFGGIDYELVFSLNPDLFIAPAVWGQSVLDIEDKLEPAGIQVLLIDPHVPAETTGDMLKLGYLLGKVDRAKEFAEFHEGFLDKIKTRTEELSEDEKPHVYVECFSKYRTSSKWKPAQLCTIAGGFNVAHDLSSSSNVVSVDHEWVLAQNPDIIVRTAREGGFGVDDTTKMKEIRDKIMNRPELANVNAVKNGEVYVVTNDLALSGLQGFVMAVYMAKWFHPDLFEDLDPEAIHQEYIDKFIRIDYDLDKHGMFVYPPLED